MNSASLLLGSVALRSLLINCCRIATFFFFGRDERNDILAVADWGQKLSFYHLSGKQVCLREFIR